MYLYPISSRLLRLLLFSRFFPSQRSRQSFCFSPHENHAHLSSVSESGMSAKLGLLFVAQLLIQCLGSLQAAHWAAGHPSFSTLPVSCFCLLGYILISITQSPSFLAAPTKTTIALIPLSPEDRSSDCLSTRTYVVQVTSSVLRRCKRMRVVWILTASSFLFSPPLQLA